MPRRLRPSALHYLAQAWAVFRLSAALSVANDGRYRCALIFSIG